MRTLCFGETRVDLICQKRVADLSEVDAFVPWIGGASANVAVTAARCGARIALASGVGADRWGTWLRESLMLEDVDLEWFRHVEEMPTGVAFLTVDEHGQVTCDRHDPNAVTVEGLEQQLLDGVQGTDALCFGSDVLADEAEARLAMAARERALELGHPIVFDPNVSLDRWDGNSGAAGAACGACVPGAFLVKCSERESRLMTGEEDAEVAARSLLAAGAQHVIVTRGARGAILRGSIGRDAVAAPASVLSKVGAGDVFLGLILGRLGASGFYPPALAAALPDAVEEAARACRRWSALE